MKHDVVSLIGKNGITAEHGQRVYDLIHPELKAKQIVELDFDGVQVFASPFFNVAIGQLLSDIEPGDLNRLLKVSNLPPHGIEVLKRVIENSKEYYENGPSRKALDDILKEHAEE